jgi:hypothetical protein
MEFNGLSINLERLQSKINSCDCRIGPILTLIISESQKQRSFPNTAITNQNYFELSLFNFTTKRLLSLFSLD